MAYRMESCRYQRTHVQLIPSKIFKFELLDLNSNYKLAFVRFLCWQGMFAVRNKLQIASFDYSLFLSKKQVLSCKFSKNNRLVFSEDTTRQIRDITYI